MTIFYIVSTIKKLNIDVNYRVNSRPNSDIAQFYVPVSVSTTACIQTCIIMIMLFKCYKTQYTVITLLSGLLWKSKQLHKRTSTFRRCQINGNGLCPKRYIDKVGKRNSKYEVVYPFSIIKLNFSLHVTLCDSLSVK